MRDRESAATLVDVNIYDHDEKLDIPAAAVRANRHPNTIGTKVRRGEIPAEMVIVRGRAKWQIRAADLDAWKAAQHAV